MGASWPPRLHAWYLAAVSQELEVLGSLAMPPRFEVLRAARAIRALMADPDDLPQVFTIIDALDGTAPHRMYLGFRRSRSGQRLLSERPDIVPALVDRQALARLPEGSLGRAYLAFVEREGISAEGILGASLAAVPARRETPGIRYVRCRMRDTHDLWHALTGYHGDVVGELALLAFALAQHWNTGVALIVAAAIAKGFGREELAVVRDGFARGRRARWLPALDWESRLARPLAEVQAELRLEPLSPYREVRTAELRQEGLVG